MTIGLPVRPHYGSAISGREQSLIVGYEMEAQEGVLINKEVTGAAGGSNGTLAGTRLPVQMCDPIHGNGLRFYDVLDRVDFTQVGDTHTAGTILMTVRPWDLIGSTFRLFHANPGVTQYRILFHTAAGNLRTQFGDAILQATTYDGLIGKSFRLAVTWANNHVYVYVDSVPVGDYAANFADDIAAASIGFNGADAFNGEAFDYQLLRRQLSATEVLADYMQYATRAHYLETLRSVWVSSADNIAGQLENSRWMIQSINGTAFRVVDAPELARLSRTPNVKAIECTGDGQIWIANQHLGLKNADPEAAYGTIEFWVNHADVSETYIYFITDSNNVGTVNGYRMHLQSGERMFVRRITAGGVVGGTGFRTPLLTIPVATWTKYTVIRRYDGRFTIYMNDQLLPTDEGSDPFTDNTHQLSSYILLDIDDGDQFGLLSQRWGEIL